jgi:hypothetical protein
MMKRLCLNVLMVGALVSCTSSRVASDLAGKTIAEIAAYEQELENKIEAESSFYKAQAKKLRELEGSFYLPEPKQAMMAKAAAAEADDTLQLKKMDEDIGKLENAPAVANASEAVKTKAAADMELATRRRAGLEENKEAGKTHTDAAGSPDAASAAVEDVEAKVRRSLAYLRIAHSTEAGAVAAVDSLLEQGVPTARTALVKYLQAGLEEDSAAIEKAVAARQAVEQELLTNLAALEAGKERLETAREALADLRKKKSKLNQVKEIIEFGKEVREKMDANAAKPAA